MHQQCSQSQAVDNDSNMNSCTSGDQLLAKASAKLKCHTLVLNNKSVNVSVHSVLILDTSLKLLPLSTCSTKQQNF